MVGQSATIEAGHVYLPSNVDWLDSFLIELLAFPNGHYDDQVDSVSQFLNWAALRKFLDRNMLVGIGTFDANMPIGQGAKVFRNGIQIY